MTIERIKMTECEIAFNDWNKLLKRAGAEDLLLDPYSVWLESWSQAAMYATSLLQHNLESTPLELAVILERNLAK